MKYGLSWAGLAGLAAGSALLVFPFLPTLDFAGQPPARPDFLWPLGLAILLAGVTLLVAGRKKT